MEIARALQVLGLEPGPAYSAQQIHEAAAREQEKYALWRYPAGSAEQARAAAWLAEIEQALGSILAAPVRTPLASPLQPSGQTAAAMPAAWPQSVLDAPARRPRRRLNGWAIAGIVTASVVILGGIGLGIVNATNAVSALVESAVDAVADEVAGGDEQTFYSAGETLFTFPATLEFVDDPYAGDECFDIAEACWVVEFVTEADCEQLTMWYWLYTDESDPGVTLSKHIGPATAGEPLRVGFGSDDPQYTLGAVGDLECGDPSAT